MTSPVNSGRRSAGSDDAPRASARRSPFTIRVKRDPRVPATVVIRSAEIRPDTCRGASHRRTRSGSGPSRPRMATRSPASRSRRASAASPRAHSSTRRPPSTRTSAFTARPTASAGSPTSVTTPSIERAAGGDSPAHDRAANALANSATPTHSTAGRRNTNAPATTPAPMDTDSGRAASAPAAAATASTTTARSDMAYGARRRTRPRTAITRAPGRATPRASTGRCPARPTGRRRTGSDRRGAAGRGSPVQSRVRYPAATRARSRWPC